ncbi:MAG: YggU family protein [Deltaproteobacteria bacterium]|nr:YggU family protein [Candidatus Zymogenaceae bacterium]
MLTISEKDGSAVFSVRVKPGGKKDEVIGVHDGALKLSVTAPPVEGKANRAVSKFISRLLGIAPSRVSIVSGESSRTKRVKIEGLSAQEVKKILSDE